MWGRRFLPTSFCEKCNTVAIIFNIMGPVTSQGVAAGSQLATAQGSSIFDPPLFSLEKKLEYREKMEAWIELVAQRAQPCRLQLIRTLRVCVPRLL